jgi:serine/threonine protein phosphatase 1
MHNVIGSCGHVHQYDLREFKGRIFAVSDLHGHYDLLHEALKEVAFDSTKDLLFVGGDWTDRGPDSKHVLDYVNEPWVHSIQGNHERMFIDGFESHWHPNNRSVLTLKAHGGGWIWNSGLTDLDKILIHEAFNSMPLAIELLLPNNNKVGIIHAEVPYNDWNKWLNINKSELEWDGMATAQWARTWYSTKYQGEVKGVDCVLVGHTPTDSNGVEQYGNMVFIDGGSFFSGKINFVEINDEFIRRVKCL